MTNLEKTKREKIIETAIELFANKGYHSTSINIIAQQAGVSKGLMYNYFSGKEDLLKHIFEDGINKIMHNLDISNENDITRDDLLVYVNNIFQYMKYDKDFWLLFFSVTLQPGVQHIVREFMIKELSLPLMNMFVNYYTSQGVEDPYAKTRYFFAVMDGVGLHYLLDPESFPINKTVKEIVKNFV